MSRRNSGRGQRRPSPEPERTRSRERMAACPFGTARLRRRPCGHHRTHCAPRKSPQGHESGWSASGCEGGRFDAGRDPTDKGGRARVTPRGLGNGRSASTAARLAAVWDLVPAGLGPDRGGGRGAGPSSMNWAEGPSPEFAAGAGAAGKARKTPPATRPRRHKDAHHRDERCTRRRKKNISAAREAHDVPRQVPIWR